MIQLGTIYSPTEFQRNTREHIDRMKKSGQPEVLTVGRANHVAARRSLGTKPLRWVFSVMHRASMKCNK